MSLRSWKPSGIAIPLAVLILLLGAASAAAAVRYAAPGGTGAAPCEDEHNPCSIFAAASVEGPLPRAQPGDEVVLASGSYSDAANDLGPNNVVRMVAGVSMHGIAGQPRPVISSSSPNAEAGLRVNTGDSVSWLEIQSSSRSGVVVSGGVLERVIVRGENAVQGFAACSVAAPMDSIIRDSACLAGGPSSIAVRISQGGGAPLKLTLRNVTAIATGTDSVGLSFFAMTGATVAVDAKAVIAEGVQDVEATATSSGSSSSVALASSEFDSATANPIAGGVASVTAAGTAANITPPPLLAADLLHEVAGSPSIDRGIADGSSGLTDIDGEPRTIGSFPDIGADERTAPIPTTTTVACAPASLEIGDPSTCTATVVGNPGSGEAPGGSVTFASNERADGFIPPAASCVLAGEGSGKASCHVAFVPAPPELRSRTVTATYPGDNDHDPSAGVAHVTVSKRMTSTRVVCSPATLALDGSSATCLATVENTFANPSAPSRIVFFTAPEGDFSDGGACTLTDEGGGKASCHVNYSPRKDGNVEITATYFNDDSHEASAARTQLNVPPRPTATTLACAPSALPLGASSTCTATVTEVSPFPVSVEETTIEFAGDSQGAFDNGGACTLRPVSNSQATCQLTYTPAALGLPTRKITATFRGDRHHGPSQGSAEIEIAAPPVVRAPVPRAPDTTLRKKPTANSARRLAVFAFASDQADSTFQCKLDRAPFKPCRSPFTKKMRPGRHTISVRAISPAGQPDRTPVTFHWKVTA